MSGEHITQVEFARRNGWSKQTIDQLAEPSADFHEKPQSRKPAGGLMFLPFHTLR